MMFSFLHLELTSRCNKSCGMCGRRKIEREHPKLCDWGDMPFDMVMSIADQVPRETVVQFHNNGEPTLYPELGDALAMFPHCIRQFDTNGKLLVEKADEIIDNLDVLTVSVIQDDPEGETQYEIVKEFLHLKAERKPLVVFRLLGDVVDDKYCDLSGLLCKRVLHDPLGSFGYEKQVTIPEIGICLELLTHLAIDRYGNISLCVRFDPEGHLRLGNVKNINLEHAWKGRKRQDCIRQHIEGLRNYNPTCATCDYWGVPRG